MSRKKTGVYMIGDWAQVKARIGGMPGAYRAAVAEALPLVGLKAEQIAVKHIKNQDLGWKENAPAYAETKLKEGKSEKILVRTSTYMQSITSKATHNSVTAGVYRTVKYKKKDGSAKVYYIAAILEFGSVARGIPARPLWRPTFAEVRDWLRSEQFFAKYIAKKINEQG